MVVIGCSLIFRSSQTADILKRLSCLYAKSQPSLSATNYMQVGGIHWSSCLLFSHYLHPGHRAYRASMCWLEQNWFCKRKFSCTYVWLYKFSVLEYSKYFAWILFYGYLLEGCNPNFPVSYGYGLGVSSVFILSCLSLVKVVSLILCLSEYIVCIVWKKPAVMGTS